MSDAIPDSRKSAPRAAAGESRGLLTSARSQRFRVDDLLREIGRRGRLSSRATPIAWGLGGFLIGAMFWHVIGFWGVLSTVVLKGPETAVSVVVRQQPVDPPLPVVRATLPNCTALALDRSRGQTYSVPCHDHLPQLEEARFGRQDLVVAEAR